MPIARCAWLVSALVVAMAGTAAAQAPTLPNDSLHANFAPRFRLEPDPERVPAAPGDPLEVVTAEATFPGRRGPTHSSASRRRSRFRRGSPDSGWPEPGQGPACLPARSDLR